MIKTTSRDPLILTTTIGNIPNLGHSVVSSTDDTELFQEQRKREC
jgi:hypothetical protein